MSISSTHGLKGVTERSLKNHSLREVKVRAYSIFARMLDSPRCRLRVHSSISASQIHTELLRLICCTFSMGD